MTGRYCQYRPVDPAWKSITEGMNLGVESCRTIRGLEIQTGIAFVKRHYPGAAEIPELAIDLDTLAIDLDTFDYEATQKIIDQMEKDGETLR